MYETKKVRINWKGIFLRLLLIAIIVLIIILLLPLTKKDDNTYSKEFKENMSSMKELGKTYFADDLPTKEGETKTATLNQLVKENKIDELKTKKNSCDGDISKIKLTKTAKGYELEVYLICGDERSTSYTYLGTYKSKTTNDVTESNKTTTKKSDKTTTKTTTKKTTKKTTHKTTKKTTKKTTTTVTTTATIKYTVIFNSNGGTLVNAIRVEKGMNVRYPGAPEREGYTFEGWYLNDKLFDFNTKINSNIILIAKWKVKDNI